MAKTMSGAVAVVCVLVAGGASAEQLASPVDPTAVPPVAAAMPAAEQTPGGVPLAAAEAVPVRSARNSIFLELGGNGLVYTINYDRVVSESFSIRVGLGYMAGGVTSSSGGETASVKVSAMGIPLMANYLLGSANHKLELGGGLTLFRFTGSGSSSLGAEASVSGIFPVGTAVIGYRYVPADGGFTFRAGFTPILTQDRFVPWAGLSFGYLF
jgi:hypothetical protein